MMPKEPLEQIVNYSIWAEQPAPLKSGIQPTNGDVIRTLNFILKSERVQRLIIAEKIIESEVSNFNLDAGKIERKFNLNKNSIYTSIFVHQSMTVVYLI